MKKGSPPPSDPDGWVAAVTGWRRPLVETMRAAIMSAAPFVQVVKWHNLVFVAGGPCVMIRVEDVRVLLGFWRGKRLLDRDPQLKASGKYELANIVLGEGDAVDAAHIAALAVAAAALNAEFGDPTKLH